MFEVTLVIVPPGGGEADYSLRMQVPALPREGDYISVLRKREAPAADDQLGTEDFIVRRVWWSFEFPDDGKAMHVAGEDPVGSLTGIGVECEFARGHYSSEAHKRACGETARTFEASAY
jgi:hypothetical protein